MLRVGIDIGGTFTDFVIHDSDHSRITTYKLLTDTANPALTVLQGLNKIPSIASVQIIHGSTVATNALLEKKGARTALITTLGFKDVLQIGRQNRPDLYNWNRKPPPPLVPSELRFEIDERIDYQGSVQRELNLIQLDELEQFLADQHVDSVAVCFLFSFLYPAHERLIADRLRKSGFQVSASIEILPEFREYERTSTTVVNAYVSPILNHYLSNLESALPNSSLRMMQSNGGMISLQEARQHGVRCILSGPAGGIVGAQNIAQSLLDNHLQEHKAEQLKLITFDMGGTSTDVSLINNQPLMTTDASIGGYPIHIPILDIHTIGAGGGSIATIDAGGALRVGPQSAGASPGPACYGTGNLPTVTDANLVLGRILPDHFLGGQMPLYPERALAAVTKLGESMGMPLINAALGIIEVVNTQMERALRVISVERGHDPIDFSLFSFGGAGGLHAVDLARRVGIPRVIIAKYASTLSAYGMLASHIIRDYVKTVMLSGEVTKSALTRHFSSMRKVGLAEIKGDGILPEKIELQTSLDVRYQGQSYELNIPYTSKFIQDFHLAHQQSYGYAYPEKPVEIVNLRLRAIGHIDPIHLPDTQVDLKYLSPQPMAFHEVVLANRPEKLPVYEYEQLPPGSQFYGPALIVSSDTTILLGSKDLVKVDRYLNLLIDVSSRTNIPS